MFGVREEIGWMGWDGMGWDGMGWDGMGWDGMGGSWGRCDGQAKVGEAEVLV